MLFPVEKPIQRRPSTLARPDALPVPVSWFEFFWNFFKFFKTPQIRSIQYSTLTNPYTLISLNQARAFVSATNLLEGAGTRLAVIDTGIRPTHDAFWNRVVLERNFTRDNGSSTDDAWDTHGHGSHVTGIAAGGKTAVLPEGIAPKCDIIAVKVLDGQGRGSLDLLAKALAWLCRLTPSVDVVSISLGDPGAYEEPRDAIQKDRTYRSIARSVQELERRGTVVVAAAGNGYYAVWRYGHAFPAILASVLPAGAFYIDNYGLQSHPSGWIANSTAVHQIAPFSQRLPGRSTSELGLTVFAPGAKITSASHLSDSGIAEAQGTSQAAPMISGVCLLLCEYMKRQGQSPDPAIIRQAIRYSVSANRIQHLKSGAGVDPIENDNAMGPRSTPDTYTRLDALIALQKLSTL